MSVAALSALTRNRELKTLTIDIERLPGLARVWQPRTKYVHPDNFVRWPRSICFAARFLGDKKMEFVSEWEHGADGLAERSFELFQEADLVLHYNGARFDVPHLQSAWAERDMGRPSTWKDIDLLKTVRQTQGWEAKSLNEVCKRLNIPAKNDRYDPLIAEAAIAGDIKAQKRLKGYNVNDVKILETAYLRLLPFIKAHPHVAPSLGLERATCPRCASTNVSRVGTYTPGSNNYPEFTCNDCHGPFRLGYESRGPSVRAL